MFVARMRREGREKEFREKITAAIQATGQRFNQVSWPVMREMGYISAADERDRLRKHEETMHLTSRQLANETIKEEIRAERVIENFEEAVRMLPDKCSVSDEIDWIRAHPAMSRLGRSKNNLKHVDITAEDVLMPPHGRAPSKSAVYALQHWCNMPNEFYKQILAEQKKRQEDGTTPLSGETEEDLTEVREILNRAVQEKMAVAALRRSEDESGMGQKLPDAGDNLGAVAESRISETRQPA